MLRLRSSAAPVATHAGGGEHRCRTGSDLSTRWWYPRVDGLPTTGTGPAAARRSAMDPTAHDPHDVTDLDAAAALVAAGFRLAGVEPDARGGRPTRFVFDPDDRLAATLQQHHSR